MDYLKHSESEAENSCRLSHNSHRIIKFLLSVSLLSALISLLPLFLKSLKPFLMQLDSSIIGKNYMFLLCNGILVLIAKNSGLINGSNHSRELNVENPESSRAELKVLESEEPNLEIVYPEEDKILIRVSGSEEDNEDWCNNAFVIIGEDELDAGETEELQKKCEELVLRENDVGAEHPWLEAEEDDDDDGVSGAEEDWLEAEEDDDDDGVSGAEEDWLEAEETEELKKKCEELVLRENDVGAEHPEEDESLVMVEGQEEEDDDGVSCAEEDWLEAEETEELNKKCEKFIIKMKTAFFKETRFEYNSGFDNQKALVAV